MTSTEHHKHPKLKRPSLGHFGRHEWAILGAPCEVVQSLAHFLISGLSDRYQCAYADARHVSDHEKPTLPGALASDAAKEYTDAIQYRQFTDRRPWNQQQFNGFFADCDAVFVNGNHHAAAAQVLIIDPKKEGSVQRRIQQLTNVQLVLAPHADQEVFDFLKAEKPEIAQVPRLLLDDREAILQFFETELERQIPSLCGLTLAGGFSLRMGFDKGTMDWHGRPQREYLADLQSPWCEQVFISCREEQTSEWTSAFPALPDTFLGLGPFGAILSAFRAQPDTAWLVGACDMPLLDAKTLEYLVKNRSPKDHATAFWDPTGEFPEPLITIWEPKAYPALLSLLAQGYSCPRKALTFLSVRMLPAPDASALKNVNTPEDAAEVRELLRKRSSA